MTDGTNKKKCDHIYHLDCFEDIRDGELAMFYTCKGVREQNSHQYHDNKNVDLDKDILNNQQPAQIDSQKYNQTHLTGTDPENDNQ